MQVIVHGTKPRRARRSRVQARFDKLRERIERERQKNDKLTRELDGLARWLETQRGEIERDVLDASRRLTARLIGFFKRKSLSNWHREELVEWISEMGEQVSAIDSEAGAELHQQFVDAMGVHFDMSEDEMERRFREHLDSMADEFGLDDDEFDDDIQPDLFDDEETDSDSAWHAENAGTRGPELGAAATDGAGRLTDANWLRSLFRRAAQALHPDRETDPEQHAHKQERLQQLLQARKDGDVLTILGLYAEVSGDQELALAEVEMKQACELMERQLERLQYEAMEIIGKSPLHSWAHGEFYGITRNQRERAIARWKEEAAAETRRVTRLTEELKNLDVLKHHLRQRREEKIDSLGTLDDFFDHLFR